MKEPLWLTRDDALAAHEMMLAQHGGLEGVRDEGLLESALAKPQNKYAYGSLPSQRWRQAMRQELF
jgi:death-on-curing protein